MKYGKPVFFSSILLFAFVIAIALLFEKTQTPLKSSFVPILQVLGEPFKAVDTTVGKLLPVNEWDEKKYGQELKKYFSNQTNTNSPSYYYLNSLMQELAKKKQKPFDYKVFILQEYYPNAFALPGGVILITQPLLNALKDEGELVAILAHEMGHIESGHCFDAAKFTLLSKKINLPAAELANILSRLFFKHSFSKNQENDADVFSYNQIVHSSYDPFSLANAFSSLQEVSRSVANSSNQRANLLRDYFSSHPPLAMRIEKYNQEALHWWKNNPQKKRYAGKRNLQEKQTLQQVEHLQEWQTFKKSVQQ